MTDEVDRIGNRSPGPPFRRAAARRRNARPTRGYGTGRREASRCHGGARPTIAAHRFRAVADHSRSRNRSARRPAVRRRQTDRGVARGGRVGDIPRSPRRAGRWAHEAGTRRATTRRRARRRGGRRGPADLRLRAGCRDRRCGVFRGQTELHDVEVRLHDVHVLVRDRGRYDPTLPDSASDAVLLRKARLLLAGLGAVPQETTSFDLRTLLAGIRPEERRMRRAIRRHASASTP